MTITLTRTWYTDANYAASDNSTAAKTASSIIFALKNLLMGNIGAGSGGLWTLENCSNGAGTVSASDILGGGTYDSTKFVWANAGSNHTWFVLKSPADFAGTGVPLYLCVDLVGTSTQNMTYAFSYNAFSTGGTATARPTATNEWAPASFQFMDNTAAAHKIHMSKDANGNFWFMTSKNGTGLFHFMLCAHKLDNTRSGDNYKAATFHSYLASGRGACSSWQSSSVVGGRSYNNGSTLLALSYIPTYWVNSGEWGALVVGANAVDANHDILPVPPILVNSTGGVGAKGTLPDLYLVSGNSSGNGVSIGSNYPTAASPERTVVGNWLIPYSGTPSL